jgi:hypothetical protein
MTEQVEKSDFRGETVNLGPVWRRHEMRGEVCLRCGFLAFWQAARNVHERRALRGLGCIHDHSVHTEPLPRHEPVSTR